MCLTKGSKNGLLGPSSFVNSTFRGGATSVFDIVALAAPFATLTLSRAANTAALVLHT